MRVTLAALLLAGAFGCSGGDPLVCAETCEAGSQRCVGDDQLEVCNDFNEDGCFEWQLGERCDSRCAGGACQGPALPDGGADNTADGGTSSSTDGGLASEPALGERCDTPGAVNCGLIDSVICLPQEDGLRWSDFPHCPLGSICRDGLCQPPEGSCCDPVEAYCDERALVSCDAHGEACGTWSSLRCDGTCNDGRCLTAADCQSVCDSPSSVCSYGECLGFEPNTYLVRFAWLAVSPTRADGSLWDPDEAGIDVLPDLALEVTQRDDTRRFELARNAFAADLFETYAVIGPGNRVEALRVLDLDGEDEAEVIYSLVAPTGLDTALTRPGPVSLSDARPGRGRVHVVLSRLPEFQPEP